MGEPQFDRRVQANVPLELKQRVRALVANRSFESEAEVVRTALRQLLDGVPARTPMPAADGSPEPRPDRAPGSGLALWMLAGAFVLLAAGIILAAVARRQSNQRN